MSRSHALEGATPVPFPRVSIQVNLAVQPVPRMDRPCYRDTVGRRSSGCRLAFFLGKATSWLISVDRYRAGNHTAPLAAWLRVLSPPVDCHCCLPARACGRRSTPGKSEHVGQEHPGFVALRLASPVQSNSG